MCLNFVFCLLLMRKAVYAGYLKLCMFFFLLTQDLSFLLNQIKIDSKLTMIT